ncbi:MAG: hypothetical protein KAH22_02390 [Thiotrichaceae bacterium]|nr:hypothetical protein [Thiotrichaceae bacterium]
MKIPLIIIILLGIITYYFISKSKSVDLADYKETTGIILSSNIYQEGIETNVRSTSSGLSQRTIHKRWKLTISYSYIIDGKTFIGIDSIMAGSGVFGKIMGKPTKEELFDRLITSQSLMKVSLYYKILTPDNSILK